MNTGPNNTWEVDSPGIQHVRSVELFFDLVFVFAITQLTSLVTHPSDIKVYFLAMLVFMTLMWMYSGYTWLTSNLTVEGPRQRKLYLVAMAGFFVMALGIPDVFGSGGLPYGLGLLGVTLIHAYLFSTSKSVTDGAIRNIAVFNISSALLVLAAAFVNPPWDWPLWVAAVSVLIVATIRRRERHFNLSPSHFVERSGLLLIIALGESIVSVGSGARGLPLNLPRLVMAGLALLISAAVWWTYFDKDVRTAEHTFKIASPGERTRMALLGFGYAHFVMIVGIILLAAGLHVGIVNPTGHLYRYGTWNLAFGLAIYLIGDAMYRHVLKIGPSRLRLLVALLALATVPVGYIYGTVAQVALCFVIMQPIWMIDREPAVSPT